MFVWKCEPEDADKYLLISSDFDPIRVLAQLHGFDLVAGTDISEGLETDLSGNSLYHPESQISLHPG